MQSKIPLYIYRSVFFIIVMLIAAQLISFGIGRGGRWVMNEQIASALNYKQTGNFYTTPGEGYLTVKTPYSPGLSFLISFLSLDNLKFIRAVLMVMATLTCLLFLQCSIFISRRFLFTIEDKYLFGIIFAGIFGSCLSVYLNYSAEFKPNNIALLIAIGTTLLIFQEYRKGNGLYAIMAMILGMAGIYFKQQFIFIFFLNFFIIQYVLLFRKKIVFFSTIMISTILFFYYFISSEIFTYTFSKPSGHPIQPGNISFVINEFKTSPVFYFAAIISLILSIIYIYVSVKNLGIYACIGKFKIILLLQALLWFSGELISTFKAGGNEGNVQTGLVLFMPFIVFLIYEETHKRKLLVVLFFLFIVSVSAVKVVRNNMKDYAKTQSIDYAIRNLKISRTESVLISDDLYTNFKNASFEKINSLNSIFYFFANPVRNQFDFYSYLDNRILTGNDKITYVISNYSFEDMLSIYTSMNHLKYVKLLQEKFKIKEVYSYNNQRALYVYQNLNTIGL